MAVIVRSLTIRATPAAVWAVLIDLERQSAWMHDLKAITPASPGPVAIGFRAVGRVRMFGVAQDDPIEVTALDPPRHYGLRHEGAFSGRGDFWLEPLPGGRSTRVTWREELRPRAVALRLPVALDPLLSLLAVVGSPVFAWIFRSDLRRLRDVVIRAR